MNRKPGWPKRIVAYALVACLVSEPALGAVTDISPVPLGFGAGTTVLPNLLFTLDDSGSMDWDYLPDYVNDPNPCMTNESGGTTCSRGDPPYMAGGQNGFNGVAYDPKLFYQPGITSTGTTVLSAPLNTTALSPDAYLGGSSVNLTTGITDKTFCNSASTPACKRSGADTSGTITPAGAKDPEGNTLAAGQFPYRANVSSASTINFGLPEMMTTASFARSGSTVTATTIGKPSLTTSDKVYVTGASASLNVTCVAVTSVSANAFTYSTGTSGTVAATNGSYRKCDSGTWSRSSGGTLITVTRASGHNLVSNDLLVIDSDNNSQDKTTAVAITVTGANTFTYTGVNSGTTSGNVAWVRTGLYNDSSTSSGPAISYSITPVEYCSDVALTNCVEVIPPAAPPAGFTFPAYVRFCQTQAQAIAPGAVGDAAGTPRCRGKYVNATGVTQYLYPRYGWFNRDTIKASVASYGNRPNRSDCAAAPTCTYNEEIQNYARWYTYYRKRMMMMKTAAGRAFYPFIGNPGGTPTKPNTLRVGFITIHAQDSGTVSAANYLKISEFNTTQASNFYTKFYAQDANGATPLLPALSRAGWIFAGKLNTGLTKGIPTADDPMQVSCQRNYSLLTTDGYWNSGSGQTLSAGAIGNQDNQDNLIVAPYTEFMVDRHTTGTLDGVGTQVTTVTPISTVTEQNVCQGPAANLTTFGTGTQAACNCASGQHRIKQRALATVQTVVTVDGLATSNTSGTVPTFSDATACSPAVLQTETIRQTVVEDNICTGINTNTTFTGSAQQACGCTSSTRKRIKRRTQDQTRTKITTDGVLTSDTTVVNSSSFSDLTNPCVTSGTTLTIALNPNPTVTVNSDVFAPPTGTPLTAAPPQTVLGGTPTSTTVNGGTPDTLADVALYYFKTDLRNAGAGPTTSPNATPPGSDVATNNVPTRTGAKDFPTHQHMVTFTVGMADGLMRYQADYDTATTGDFANIKNGAAGACFWTPGTCNWPTPADDTPMALDDLWHAAVNGRGQYYQALNAGALSVGLQSALTALSLQVAAAAASATSSPNVTQTDNQIFSTTYETNTWSGKVFAQSIDPVTAEVSAATQWEADTLLLNRVAANSDTRNLYTFDATNPLTHLKPFAWASLNATEQSYFANRCSPLSTMTQCALLAPAQLAIANDGSRLVGFLRGWQQDEATAFRDRIVTDPVTLVSKNSVLGDTVASKPAFVRNPTFSYSDAVTPSYATFRSANANRAARVYVGANDGYLHAFDGDTGAEAWAYAPRFLLPGMYALADQGYTSQHRYYVDGSPEFGDVFDSTASAWKTIVVGGSAGGGRGFYALDVTDPVAPKALWEFCNDSSLCAISDSDLGLSYGNPVIGKRSYDGKWIVVVTSGLNNVSPGSGIGYFYVLDALTGAILSKVATTAGTVATPAGLMKASAFYDSPLSDASFRYLYGGDQLGNVWRLDVSTATPTVLHIARLVDASSPARAQPITTRPTLTHIGAHRVLYIGTGRYLGNSDLTDPGAASGIAWQQTLYGLKDKDADYGTNVRTGANLQTQTLTKLSPTTRGVSGNSNINWDTQDGWLIDFNPAADPTPGERVNIDPRIVLGTVVVITNIPTVTAGTCEVAGSSKLYGFDFKTGLAVETSIGGVAGVSLGGALAVGGAIVQTSVGAIKDIVTLLPGTKSPSDVPPPALAGTLKRFSYRVR